MEISFCLDSIFQKVNFLIFELEAMLLKMTTTYTKLPEVSSNEIANVEVLISLSDSTSSCFP